MGSKIKPGRRNSDRFMKKDLRRRMGRHGKPSRKPGHGNRV